MSIWQRIGEVLDGGVTAIGVLFERVGTALAGDPEMRRQVAFSMAMIALSAKMAKADGVVTADEVAVFQSIFIVPPGEARNVVRLFNIANRDVAGFESYATRIAALYASDRPSLEDVLDGLFAIARADGAVHEAEFAYLARVGEIFGIAGRDFERIAARHVLPADGDPYLILGMSRGSAWAALRGQYRKLVADNHPDRMIARGLPAEAIALANERLAAINAAWDRIERERAPT